MRVSRRKAKAGRQIALRVEEILLSAIDAEVARLRRERPGANPHRSDAVREILYRALIASSTTHAQTPDEQASDEQRSLVRG